MKLKIDKQKLIDRMIEHEDEIYTRSMNGYWGIIIPNSCMNNEEYTTKPTFIQTGTEYRNCHVLHVNEFFDDEIYNETDFDFQDSRQNAKQYHLETEDQIQEATDEHIKYCKEILSGNLLQKVNDEDAEGIITAAFDVYYI